MIRDYFRTNWGAPFILAFIILLVISAILLSIGSSSAANDVAIYAFYALVLGVVLQIGSFVKYGEHGPSKPSSIQSKRNWKSRRLIILSVMILIVLIGIAASVYIFQVSPRTQTSRTTSTTKQTSISKLSASLNFINVIPSQNKSAEILFGVNESGGVAPFTFTAMWSDGMNQTNDVGVFTRSFLENSVPSSVVVIVKSADSQSVSVVVQIPQVTQAMSTSYAPIVNFTETGLIQGIGWSVTLNNKTLSSSANSIVFVVSPGTYDYSVSYPYTSNFSLVYFPTPKEGNITIAQTSVQVKISYAPMYVTIPADQLFTIKGKPTLVTTGGITGLSISFTNNFPTQLHVVVLAYVSNSTSRSLEALEEAAMTANSGSTVSTIIPLEGLNLGNYSANIFVQSLNGVRLSEITNTSFTLAPA